MVSILWKNHLFDRISQHPHEWTIAKRELPPTRLCSVQQWQMLVCTRTAQWSVRSLNSLPLCRASQRSWTSKSFEAIWGATWGSLWTFFKSFWITYVSTWDWSYFDLVYDRNHYFGLGRIPKSKLANTFGRYHNRYRNQISKEESTYL